MEHSLEQIQALWDKDAQLELDTLTEHSLQISQLHNRYYKILINERVRQKTLENSLNQLKLEKYEMFVHGPTKEHAEKGWDIPHTRILKSDVEMYLNGDKQIIELSNKIMIQNEKVKFLEAIISVLNRRSFDIRNAIEFERWKSGG